MFLAGPCEVCGVLPPNPALWRSGQPDPKPQRTPAPNKLHTRCSSRVQTCSHATLLPRISTAGHTPTSSCCTVRGGEGGRCRTAPVAAACQGAPWGCAGVRDPPPRPSHPPALSREPHQTTRKAEPGIVEGKALWVMSAPSTLSAFFFQVVLCGAETRAGRQIALCLTGTRSCFCALFHCDTSAFEARGALRHPPLALWLHWPPWLRSFRPSGQYPCLYNTPP